MTHRPIAYSLVCSFFGALQPTPRGVERIDFGYISHLFESWPGECFGVVPTPWGIRYYPRDMVLSGRDRLAAIWHEVMPASDDPRLAELARRYAEPAEMPPMPPMRRNRFTPSGIARAFRLFFGGGVKLGRPVRKLPQGAIFMDVGHDGLAYPYLTRWLEDRPDIRPVFMLHDAIPLEFPEFVTPDSVKVHHRIVDNAARRARALIVPTNAVRMSVLEALAQRGAAGVPVHAATLPIETLFARDIAPAPGFETHPYFLALGAVEPRKNQQLLVDVWRDLVLRHGEAAPRLILAGRPEYTAEPLINEIRRSRVLRRHVYLASGLSSPALARLIAGARAVLMPSFAEGFGLPPIEAMAMGTPAILSDIAAHRDAAGAFGQFIEPTDGPGWRRAVEELTFVAGAAEAARQRIAAFRPKDWASYMAEVSAILEAID